MNVQIAIISLEFHETEYELVSSPLREFLMSNQ